MTFEQRVKAALGEQAWLILALQQRVDTVEQQLAEWLQPSPPMADHGVAGNPNQQAKAAVSQFPMAVNSTTTQ